MTTQLRCRYPILLPPSFLSSAVGLLCVVVFFLSSPNLLFSTYPFYRHIWDVRREDKKKRETSHMLAYAHFLSSMCLSPVCGWFDWQLECTQWNILMTCSGLIHHSEWQVYSISVGFWKTRYWHRIQVNGCICRHECMCGCVFFCFLLLSCCPCEWDIGIGIMRRFPYCDDGNIHCSSESRFVLWLQQDNRIITKSRIFGANPTLTKEKTKIMICIKCNQSIKKNRPTISHIWRFSKLFGSGQTNKRDGKQTHGPWVVD